MRGLSVSQLGGMALAFVLVAIVLGVGGTILTGVGNQACSGTFAYFSGNATTACCNGTATATTCTEFDYESISVNASNNGLTGIDTMADWLPTIAVIIAAAVVIGVIVRYFQG